MKLFNTLTKRQDELEPISRPEVSVYTCGPTVYDYPHIGNWFSFIRYDLLIRTLIASGFKPKWVLNITDVGHLVSDQDEGEDKLVKGAEREGKTAWQIADFYSQYFTDSLTKLNFVLPWQMPRATDHLKEQIDLITKLEQRGYSYRTTDGIYFDTSKFANYHQFAGLDLDEQQTGARVEVNPQKRNPSDFALWKFSPKDKQRDMEWDSPWGKGFPGWHIECSAMALKYLGETIDIHCGGIDHIPVHHSNEIAQSEAVTNKPLAKIWLHTNHILINDQKISKSLGNGLTLEDLINQGFSLEAFRLLVIESHYRSQSHFSWEALKAAENRLLRFKNFAALKYQSPEGGQLFKPDILNAMQDDLNTPKALAELEEFLNEHGSKVLSKGSIEATVSQIDQLWGLNLSATQDISSSQKQLLAEREEARKNGDFAKADSLRDALAKDNISVKDSANGPIWEYLS